MTRPLPIVGFCLLLLASCKKDGPTPAYVRVATPVVIDAGHAVSSKITDVWVFVNDQPAGVWEPGEQIPLIAEGSSTVKLIAGIRKNGITDDRIQYPFYATWQQQVDLMPEQTVVLNPEFHYYDNLNSWNDAFDTGQRFDAVNCTATLDLVPTDSTLVGQGSGNGRITLDTEHSVYRGVSSGDPFTTAGPTAFMEMDYRSDTRIEVGVRYTYTVDTIEVSYVYALPTKKADGSMPWNKIYINLGEPWNVTGALDKRFYIKAALENGAAAGIVDVDNIKVIWP